MNKILSATVASFKAAVGIGPRLMTDAEIRQKATEIQQRLTNKEDILTKIAEAKRKARENEELMSGAALNGAPRSMEEQAAAIQAIALENGVVAGWESHCAANDAYCRKQCFTMLPTIYARYRYLSGLINEVVETSITISRAKLTGIFDDAAKDAVVGHSILVKRAHGFADRRPSCSIGDAGADALHPDVTPERVLSEYRAVEAAIADVEAFKVELEGAS